jgi:transcriptional regulator GlxA family with amidase domain
VSRHDKHILFVAFPDMSLLDFTGPQTVFWTASNYMKQQELPAYQLHTGSIAGGLIPSIEGITLETKPLADFELNTIDTLVVPGSPIIEQALDKSTALVDWLTMAARQIPRIASVCSGAFFLAQTGLLNNKRAATHWAMCDMLQRRFPLVQAEPDAIYVNEGTIWTSAGVTTGIDMSLALVEADCGREIAMKVARELVVFLKRLGGQSQFSELLKSQMNEHAAFEKLHLWIANNLADPDISVERMAEKVSMSPRNFSRVYKQATGRTPAKAVEIMRLEAARRMLEDSERNLNQIALQCGFGDEERMRVTFQRNLAVSPTDYRKRFSK